MSWTDQKSQGASSKIVSHLPNSQPRCQAQVNLWGCNDDKPRRDVALPKGKNTTICLGRQAKGIDDIRSDAQARAIEFSDRGHKLQRLDGKPDELEQRSPERSQQTSITSLAHRDLMAGGIEAVLRRSGNNKNDSNNNINNNGHDSKNNNADEEDVPSLEELVDEGWTRSRIDPEKIHDPYLRQQGLHINDANVYSHISKRLVSSRALTKAIVDKSVDFNFQYSKKR